MKRVLVSGYYGYNNLGDELILSVLKQNIKERFPNSELTFLSCNPKKTKSQHQIRAINRWNPFSILKEMILSDVFVLGGGGLLQDKTSMRSLIYYLGLIFLGRLFCQSVILFAMGVESVNSKFGKWLIQKALSGDKIKITVRDTHSKKELVLLGISKDRIHVTGDPVFCLDPLYSKGGKEGFHKGLFIPRFPCPSKAENFYLDILNVSRSKFKIQPTLFHHSIEENLLPPKLKVFSWSHLEQEALNKIKEVYENADFVVSARFHGLVLAALSHKPFLGIGEFNKVGRICEAWGMPYLSWDANIEQVEKAFDRLKAISAEPYQTPIEAWRRSASLTFDFI